MTQIATVERIIDNHYAEVSVPRKAACGHDCENCAGCGAQGGAVTVKARTDIPVVPGDRVEMDAKIRLTDEGGSREPTFHRTRGILQPTKNYPAQNANSAMLEKLV